MSEYLLLTAIGLCLGSMITLAGARLVERAGWNLPPPLWFFVVSLSSPLAWLVLQASILGVLLHYSRLRAGLVHNLPLYLREVVIAPGLKLWLCGAICTAALAYLRRGLNESPARDARAQFVLRLSGAALGAAVIEPMTMDYWIQNGRLSGEFALSALACAFVIGGAPVTAISFGLLRRGGARAHLRYAEPLAAFYGLMIIGCGYLWHQSVVSRPGASAVIAVEICALVGVFAGWFAILRGNRTAAAVLARSADDAPPV